LILYLWSCFDDSHAQLATLFTDQPYGKYFHGKVDMFYFPFGTELYQVIAYLGGNDFTFFNAILMLICHISTGVGILIFSTTKLFKS
jgi:signal peptidase II